MLPIAVLVFALAAPARAFVPPAQRVVAGVASANAKAGRAQGLRLEVVVRGSGGELQASGTVWVEPSGAARLELREADGTREVHQIRDGALRAERDGVPLPFPRPLLPPMRMLQARSAGDLRGALLALGADADRIELGLEGEHDCYVLGGRELGHPEGRTAPVRSALWVDSQTLEPVRIDRLDGVRFRLGPLREEDSVRFPSFVEVEAPGPSRWRLEIRRAVRGSFPASAP